MVIHMVLPGPVKPYVRMTQRSMWVNKQALEYRASKEALQMAMRCEMSRNCWEMLARESLSVNIAFGRVVRRQDLDNLVKAILDAGNKIVWRDDRWIDQINAWRRDDDNLGLELWVSTVGESGRWTIIAASDRVAGGAAQKEQT
jgi:Holliday junction resolvase RusA-like endonuclease